MKGIDIVAMKNGKQITHEQDNLLIELVTEEEIMQALKDIGDLKAPSIDGYGARFFKAT